MPLITAGRSRASLTLAAGVLGAATLGFHCDRQRTPTYFEDVAPILSEHCIGCHCRSGVAPNPSLETFDQVRSAAGKLGRAVQSRSMPPWGADDTGLCGKWQDAHWLSDQEIRTLVAWASDPEPGDPARGTPRPARGTPQWAPPGAAFRPSGVVLDTGGDWRPGIGASASRCFVVDPQLPHDRLVTAFRVLSSEPRSVQQVTVYGLGSPAADQVATELDTGDEGLGYTCYGSSRVPDTHLVTSWTWDGAVLRVPSGAGLRLRGGRRLVLQIHYNPVATGPGVPTRTRIELELTDGVRAASFLPIAPTTLRLPHARSHTVATAELPVARSMTILGVAPRMHSLGKTMQLDVVRQGVPSCIGTFDHWNFYRQRLFNYVTPVRVNAGDVVRVSCVYDTRNRSAPTEMGERIDQEECLASLLFTD